VRRQSELGETGFRASILLITLAIAAIATMQFSWFSRAAAMEVVETYRGLDIAVSQAVSREYQRYIPLLADLRSARSGAPLSRSALESLLARVYRAYGPEGVTPALLRSVAIVEAEPPFVLRRYDPVGGGWKAAGSLPATAGWSPDRAAAALARGEVGLASASGSRYLLCSPRPSSTGLLVAELDSEGFFERYVVPAVTAMLPDASLSWTESVRRPPVPDGPDAPAPRHEGPPVGHRFDPFGALVGKADSATFVIKVPAALDPLFLLGGEREPRDRAAEAFRLVPIADEAAGGPPLGGRIKSLNVTMSSASRVGSMERRLALNWMLGNLLLVGIWLAFVQAVVQRRRLGLVRQREREFVASVTHELRTPLTVIGSAADNLRSGLVKGERVVQYGGLIAGQAKRLGAMIEEVLLYSRVEGREPARPALAPLGPARLDEELRGPLEELARGSGCRLSWDVSGLPPSFMGAEAGLRLVLSNLVANAAYHAYGKDSGGEIRVRGRVEAPGRILFAVEDDGRGVPRSEAALVFEPFYRDEAARRRGDKGTGLGLYLARREARSLGGELRLESPYRLADGERRHGCRFTLELPFEEVADGA